MLDKANNNKDDFQGGGDWTTDEAPVIAAAQPHTALPNRVASLDTRGLNKALDLARNSGEIATQAKDLLRTNPRELINQVFRLSDKQRMALARLTDEQLKQLVKPVAERMDSDLTNVNLEYVVGQQLDKLTAISASVNDIRANVDFERTSKHIRIRCEVEI